MLPSIMLVSSRTVDHVESSRPPLGSIDHGGKGALTATDSTEPDVIRLDGQSNPLTCQPGPLTRCPGLPTS